ncbi:MAG: UDP-3-O-(3-hydroxymyristoyl)glucosamine N-acyltransferase [Chromatiales bacterium 21-64-14]|nr:MAG: UDP-3-O-(3-hydroxymyristoyl)glucosamine N-acyltransferase [Chromatiales bacterium 21-64-14]HQU15134.1 UDP-3-O-(3-hydroxymyristoyl)glucosamine N-acyltransferase [Gammaproteobacteria bacterium]
MAFTLGELAERAGGELRGDPSCAIDGVAPLGDARPGTIAFLSNPRYRRYLRSTRASAVILGPVDAPACPCPAIVSDNPYLAYARVAALFVPPHPRRHGIHPTASVSSASRIHDSAWVGPHCVVEAGAEIGEDVFLGPGCVVGGGVQIGAQSRLEARVTLCRGTSIGRNAHIQAGAVIGGDGFGIANDGGQWVKVPQLGKVRIGDDVEIGANSTIDRGALEDTVLEDGVRLDNQIQIAHNVHIGAYTAIAGCVGISGSVRIGKRCMIGGGVGIAGHLEIADDVVITGMSLVTRSITAPGVYSSGIAVEPAVRWRRNHARLRGLDELARRVRELERRFEEGRVLLSGLPRQKDD